VPADEIAEKLRTKSSSVAIYVKLFFDVERYVSDGSGWIHSIVFSPLDHDATPWEVRERNLMAAALIRGQQAVGNLFSPSIRLSAAEREQRLGDIQAALTHRASQWLTRLELEGVSPGPEDLAALLRVTDALSRQPGQNDSHKKMRMFIAGLHGSLSELAHSPDFIGDPTLEYFRERDPGALENVKQKVLTW
jgi:hypothetical protein